MNMVKKTGEILTSQFRSLRPTQLIAVRMDSGDTASNQKVIKERFRLFYSKSTSDCTRDVKVTENTFRYRGIPSLWQEFKCNLEAPITQEEIAAL